MSSAESPALTYSSVAKRFGDTTILENFDFKLARGERVALIGPSGSGKTTLLRMAMALEVPTEGDVHVFGEPYWQAGLGRRASRRRLRQVRRSVGIVFQSYNLFPHMTVTQNMLEAATGPNQDREALRARALDLLQQVGLADRADARPPQLSGGQQQRAAIARALMLRPQLLLLDEVTSALDPELVAEVLSVIKSVAEESDVAMLIVTHEMKFARDVSDRVCVLDRGRIVEEGAPSQVFGDPQHPRTKSFMRSMAAVG